MLNRKLIVMEICAPEAFSYFCLPFFRRAASTGWITHLCFSNDIYGACMLIIVPLPRGVRVTCVSASNRFFFWLSCASAFAFLPTQHAQQCILCYFWCKQPQRCRRCRPQLTHTNSHLTHALLSVSVGVSDTESWCIGMLCLLRRQRYHP